MKRKGFTLVELLAVIAILALLAIIAIPNIVGLFNKAKKSSFENELKTIFKQAEQEWIVNSMVSAEGKTYSSCHEGNCGESLNLDGRQDIEYYIKLDQTGKVVEFYATDGTYQYVHDGELKLVDIGEADNVSDVESNRVIDVTNEGVLGLPEPVILDICVYTDSGYRNDIITCSDKTSIAECIGSTGDVYYYPQNFKTCAMSIEKKAGSCAVLSNEAGTLVERCYNLYNVASTVQTISSSNKVGNYAEGCLSPVLYGKPDYCCLDGESEVIVYDKKKKKKLKKKLKDVTYDDLVLAWDFDEGKYVWVKPFWIMIAKEFSRSILLTFSDGSTLNVVVDHKIYNDDLKRFTSCLSKTETPIGMHTINSNGELITLVSRKKVRNKVLACNVITEKHINIFVNGILTSRGSNNLYEIVNMKFIKNEEEKLSKSDLNSIPEDYIENLRLLERNVNMYGTKEETINHTKDMVERLMKTRQK